MVEEIFIMEVAPGTEAAFEADFKRVVTLFEQANVGYHGASLKRCVEQPNKFMVLVKWSSLEEHTEKFKNKPEFDQMKAILGPHYLTVPNFQHYTTLYE